MNKDLLNCVRCLPVSTSTFNLLPPLGYMATHAASLFRSISPISGHTYDIDPAIKKAGTFCVDGICVDSPGPGKSIFLHHGVDDKFVRPTGCCNDPDKPKCCCNIAADTCVSVMDVAQNWAQEVNGCEVAADDDDKGGERRLRELAETKTEEEGKEAEEEPEEEKNQDSKRGDKSDKEETKDNPDKSKEKVLEGVEEQSKGVEEQSKGSKSEKNEDQDNDEEKGAEGKAEGTVLFPKYTRGSCGAT